MHAIRFTRAAEREATNAYAWYEKERVGLGGRFLERLHECYNTIAENPKRFGFARRKIREGVVQQFPYIVYYTVGTSTVFVLSVVHTSRDQDAILKKLGRLKNSTSKPW